jgi:ribosome biogenesis protein MAK21
LLSGLITGVRRAFPFVSPGDVEPLVDGASGQLFRLVHTAPFTVAVQALLLLQQLMTARGAVSDR